MEESGKQVSYQGLSNNVFQDLTSRATLLRMTRRAKQDAPLCRVQRVLLGGLVADPDTAELPLHVLAVEHVPEEHLVAGERLPAKKDMLGTWARQSVLLTVCRLAPTDSKNSPASCSVRLPDSYPTLH